ncbi:MAG: choice-of-anchor A family protein [Bryobacterales bacterium]|nr:choice-of-anchor A family protein [Bryobacterales bacterium]
MGGKLAAGGNINISNFSVATAYPANHFDGQYALLAKGDINAANGQLFSGGCFLRRDRDAVLHTAQGLVGRGRTRRSTSPPTRRS